MTYPLTYQPVGALRRISLAALALLLLLAGLAQAPSAGAAAEDFISVIVRGESAASARRAVETTGGSVTHDLPIIDGVSADIPKSALDSLRSVTGVSQVELDAKVGFQGAPSTSMANRIGQVTRSRDLWKEGVNGAGSTVALLDTGVYAEHPDLQGSNGTSRVIHCEDFSHEEGTEAHCKDTFGHGTFMAGLIAGNGASSGGKISGAAPASKIVSVKASGFDGSTDVSTILAGIQWIVSHKDQYSIDVLNLSLGSDSAQDYRLSPLNLAVERAWQSGIVVVVSSGNSGPDLSTVMKPGDDPYVITVGASNDEGTVSINDDRIPVFSSRGPTRSNGLLKPDLVAPGVHTVSLRSPGSAIDQQFGAEAAFDEFYFKGTGTSMSTATVSGIVAQMLQVTPALAPDQVKYRLMETARSIVDTDPLAAGRGLVDAYAAAKSTSLERANQGLESATGLGTLQADRGTLDVEVVTPIGSVALIGEFSAQTSPDQVTLDNPAGLMPFSSLTYSTTGWDPTTWDGTQWRGGDWDGTQWRVADWAGTQWRGTQWRATTWDGTQWRGTQWRNEDWSGTQWRNADWDGTQWRASSWQSAWYAVAWD